MKIVKTLALVVSGFFLAVSAQGQDVDIDMLLELPAQVRSNFVVRVKTPQPCPPKYINVISNTNLFSPAEKKLLEQIAVTYENVSTNAGPTGSFQNYLESEGASGLSRAEFDYTNSEARVELLFRRDGKLASAKYRTKARDGYDAHFKNGSLRSLLQFKRGIPNGLWAQFEGDRCLSWVRISSGKAVGEWLEWNDAGDLKMEVEFRQPSDIFEQFKFNPP